VFCTKEIRASGLYHACFGREHGRKKGDFNPEGFQPQGVFKAILFGTASAFRPGPEREGSGKTAALSGERLPLALA
jgi:hypothetical protein